MLISLAIGSTRMSSKRTRTEPIGLEVISAAGPRKKAAARKVTIKKPSPMQISGAQQTVRRGSVVDIALPNRGWVTAAVGKKAAVAKDRDVNVEEAIVLLKGRPSIPFLKDHTLRLLQTSERWPHLPLAYLETMARSVGRIEVEPSTSLYLGTAWLLDAEARIAVTNRHVASIFTLRPNGPPLIHPSLSAFVNFAPHGGGSKQRFFVQEVLFMAPTAAPDVAFLRLSPTSIDGSNMLPPALKLQEDFAKKDEIAVIGGLGLRIRG